MAEIYGEKGFEDSEDLWGRQDFGDSEELGGRHDTLVVLYRDLGDGGVFNGKLIMENEKSWRKITKCDFL